MNQDAIFKGCTRPPMLFGVPMMPLLTIIGCVFIIGSWFSLVNQVLMLIIWACSFPVLLILQQLAKKDDQIFRLMYLKLLFRKGRTVQKGRTGDVVFEVFEPFDYRQDLAKVPTSTNLPD